MSLSALGITPAGAALVWHGTRPTSGGQLAFRRHLVEERQHQEDATISHQSHIYALDRLLARSSIAPRQAPAFLEQIDRPTLTEGVAREARVQCHDRTIEFISFVSGMWTIILSAT